MKPDTFEWNRRQFLVRTSAALLPSGLLLANAPPNACLLTSELEVGPYYLDRALLRKDITEGKPGIPLKLRVTVLDGTTCQPVDKAALDIWHCDAAGFYSGFLANNPDSFPGGPGDGPGGPPPGGGPPPDGFHGGPLPMRRQATDKSTFLRGIQFTGKDGIAEFDTIYPGWYVSRDIHIHLRVHIGGGLKDDKYAGGHLSHTGQLFFPDDLSDQVAKLEPYAARTSRRTRQEEDHVFTDENGSGSMMTLNPLRSSLKDGLLATAVVAIDPAATPAASGFGPRGMRPGPPPA